MHTTDSVVSPVAGSGAPTPAVDVVPRSGDAFEVRVRGHRFVVDQPLEAGGQDTGPTPTELFVASVAACVAHYARSYLRRHHLPTQGLRVRADFGTAGSTGTGGLDPARARGARRHS